LRRGVEVPGVERHLIGTDHACLVRDRFQQFPTDAAASDSRIDADVVDVQRQHRGRERLGRTVGQLEQQIAAASTIHLSHQCSPTIRLETPDPPLGEGLTARGTAPVLHRGGVAARRG